VVVLNLKATEVRCCILSVWGQTAPRPPRGHVSSRAHGGLSAPAYSRDAIALSGAPLSPLAMRLGDNDHHVPLSIAVIAGCSWKCLTVTGLLAHATPAGEALPLPAFIRCRPTQNALLQVTTQKLHRVETFDLQLSCSPGIRGLTAVSLHLFSTGG